MSVLIARLLISSWLKMQWWQQLALNSDTTMARILLTSKYSLQMLSPASQKAQVRRIMKDRKILNEKLYKYSKLCISLGDEQDSELSAVVSTINKNQ